ncbi:MAG: hypothetical protein K9M80_07300 [Candidatus Marinimicrobia bacterium]|nr:hypothetical protein [Candidatus Neomarinimicrobiota bacterium]
MHKSYLAGNEKKYTVRRDLQNLIDRLEKGMVVNGRVIEHVQDNKYLVRIWGYNIYTKSEKKLKLQDEIKFEIMQLAPNLTLNPIHSSPQIEDHSTENRTDIIVN